MKTLLKLSFLVLLFLSLNARGADSIGAELPAKAGMKRGVCSVLGAAGELPLELAEAAEMLVHAREPDAKSVYDLRRAAVDRGLGLERFTAEIGSLSKLPFADNSVDVVVVARNEGNSAIADVVRALRPEGVAFVKPIRGQRPRVRYVVPQQWNTSDGQEWLVFQKPPMKGADD